MYYVYRVQVLASADMPAAARRSTMKRDSSDTALQLVEAREVAQAKSKVKNWIKQTSRQGQSHPDAGSVSLSARDLEAALDISEKRLVQVDSQAVKVRSSLVGESEDAAIKNRGLSARTRHARLRRSNSDFTDLTSTGASPRMRERSSNFAEEAKGAPLIGIESESSVREWMKTPSGCLIPEVELMRALKTYKKDRMPLDPLETHARTEFESSRPHAPKLSEESQEGMLDGLGYLYGMLASSLNEGVQDTSTSSFINTVTADEPERRKPSKRWSF